MGKAHLAQSLNKTIEEADPIFDQYHEKVPFVREAQHHATNYAQKNGFMATLIGRRSHFEMYEPKHWERGKARPTALPREQAFVEWAGQKLMRAMTH